MDGKIERRIRKDGSVAYSQRVEGPVDPETGKRQRIRVTADTEKELRTKSRHAVRELEDGLRVKRSGETFKTFATWWMEAIVETTCRPSTIDGYWKSLRGYAFPLIGGLPLQRIDYKTLTGMQRTLSKQATARGGSLASATIRNVMAIIRRVLGRAVEMRILARNPMEQIKVPRAAPSFVPIWTVPETLRFLSAAAGDELHPYWAIAVLTGMRPGEILGLRWSDIDLESGTIRVERTRTQTASGRIFEGPPKTVSSRRTVDLPPQLIELLRAVRVARIETALQTGQGWRAQHHYVVARTTGASPSRTMLREHGRAIIEQAALPPMRLHGLRHVHASLMLQIGTNPKLVQERLGHANVKITLDVYSHVLPSAHRTAAHALGTALFNGGEDASEEETDGRLSDAL